MLTYNCDQLQWVGEPGAYASVGYSVLGSAENFRNFENYGLSRRREVGMIACTNEELNRPWTNVIYKIGVAVSQDQMERSQCLARQSQDQFFGLDRFSFFLSDCPCSVFQVFNDFRFVRDFTFTNPNAQDSICYFSRFPVFVGAYLRRRCCYSTRLA